ncbi:excisionase [Nonomuraea sp. PA05]|nr:excisionase [Nonomuraea sp. PA05]
MDEILHELGVPRRTWQKWHTRKQTPRMLRLPNGEYRIHRDDYQAWLAGLEVDA